MRICPGNCWIQSIARIPNDFENAGIYTAYQPRPRNRLHLLYVSCRWAAYCHPKGSGSCRNRDLDVGAAPILGGFRKLPCCPPALIEILQQVDEWDALNLLNPVAFEKLVVDQIDRLEAELEKSGVPAWWNTIERR